MATVCYVCGEGSGEFDDEEDRRFQLHPIAIRPGKVSRGNEFVRQALPRLEVELAYFLIHAASLDLPYLTFLANRLNSHYHGGVSEPFCSVSG